MFVTTPPCPDCLDLVGAPRATEPHLHLTRVQQDLTDRDLFRCTECTYRWLLGQQGWSSVWD